MSDNQVICGPETIRFLGEFWFLHPEPSTVVFDVYEINERFSFEYGDSPSLGNEP